MLFTLLAFTAILVLTSFDLPAGKKKAGIKGTVRLITGNQMPMVGQKVAAAPGKPMSTTVYIYALTNQNQVTLSESDSRFFSSVKTRLIKKVTSNKAGAFCVTLPPGEYSVFVKKGDLFYGSIYDGKNNINPVTVTKGRYTRLEVKADYDAVY